MNRKKLRCWVRLGHSWRVLDHADADRLLECRRCGELKTPTLPGPPSW